MASAGTPSSVRPDFRVVPTALRCACARRYAVQNGQRPPASWSHPSDHAMLRLPSLTVGSADWRLPLEEDAAAQLLACLFAPQSAATSGIARADAENESFVPALAGLPYSGSSEPIGDRRRFGQTLVIPPAAGAAMARTGAGLQFLAGRLGKTLAGDAGPQSACGGAGCFLGSRTLDR